MQNYIFSSDLEKAQSKNFKTLCGGGDMDIFQKKKNSVVLMGNHDVQQRI